MKAIFKKLAEFFQDGKYLSSYRLIHVSWALGVLAVWIMLNIYSCFVLHTVVMVGLNTTVAGFLVSLTAGKLVQNVTENKRETDGAASQTNTTTVSENKTP